MRRHADRHTEQSFAHFSPYLVFRTAAVGYNALERGRAQLCESGITRRFDMRQALQQPMQKFHITTGARHQPRRELRIVDREALADPG